MIALELRGVQNTFGASPALDGFGIGVTGGEVVAMVG